MSDYGYRARLKENTIGALASIGYEVANSPEADTERAIGILDGLAHAMRVIRQYPSSPHPVPGDLT